MRNESYAYLRVEGYIFRIQLENILNQSHVPSFICCLRLLSSYKSKWLQQRCPGLQMLKYFCLFLTAKGRLTLVCCRVHFLQDGLALLHSHVYLFQVALTPICSRVHFLQVGLTLICDRVHVLQVARVWVFPRPVGNDSVCFHIGKDYSNSKRSFINMWKTGDGLFSTLATIQ